ncbi:hypothetical protein SNE35_08785 [Paucibacter sp. R3-3]|uniref:Uncharacterized protein n=1 Tax=Roseateles agri TaxID=3098619 RepID=A0ABU5DFV6_9BURK|nr:hypothetical protein [Paucibacter sp. R3-3]MDY0744600.1 hypothetical protein [Paucibacter sp. R3-3]
MNRNKPQESQSGLPFDSIKVIAKKNRAVAAFLAHTHVLEIIEDHQVMWVEAPNEAAQTAVVKRLRRQLSYYCGGWIGFETFVHGTVALPATPIFGASLMVIGLTLIWLLRLQR